MPGPHFGWVFSGVSLMCPMVVPGRLTLKRYHCGSLWGVRWVFRAWLVLVFLVGFAVVRRAFSSAVSLGGLLRRCVGGVPGLAGSWEGAEHAGAGLAGEGGVCGPALQPSLFWALAFLACLPSARYAVSSSALPLSLSFCWFFFGGGLSMVVCALSWGGVGGGRVWLEYSVYGAGCWCCCVPVLMLVRTSWRGRPVVAAGS